MVFTGNANPKLAASRSRYNLGISLGAATVGSVLRRRSHGRDQPERQGSRRVRRAVHLRADQRAPDGAADHGRCAETRVGRAHQRGDPVLRLCAAGPQAALDARADHRESGREPARDLRRLARAHDGPARGPDPGLLRHSGGQHLRVAGAARRRAREARQRPDRGQPRRRRRGARAARWPSSSTPISRSSTSAGRARM